MRSLFQIMRKISECLQCVKMSPNASFLRGMQQFYMASAHFPKFYMASAHFPTFRGALHEASRRLVLRPITQFERRRVRLLGPDAMQLLNSSRLAEWGLVRFHRRYHFWTPFLRKGFADRIPYGLHLSSRKTSETGHTNQWAGADSVHIS